MKTLLIYTTLTFSLYFNNISFAQVGIGTVTPDASSILDMTSTTQGFLPPRMTEGERDLITASKALIIYNTTTNELNYYNGSAWRTINTSTGFVDLTTNQAIAGNKTFNGNIIAGGRLMIPMGEISYFNYSSGHTVNITSLSSGVTGNDNMVKIEPAGTGTVNFINDMFDSNFTETTTVTNSRLQYTGATTRYFHIALSFSYQPTKTGDVFVFGVAQNGDVKNSSKIFIKSGQTSDHQSSAMHVLLKLVQNDYLEFYVGNLTTSGQDIIIKSMNFVAIGM